MIYLQSEAVAGASLLLMAIFVAIIIIIQVIIIRWIFKIDTQIKHQRAQIFILLRIWEKQGGTKEEVDNFLKSFSIK
ncbi:MAG: hypothetical protein JST87_05515 [Bacteroidetes bacterium]|nr:hypothetical protein [Bacteroidota bacterium]